MKAGDFVCLAYGSGNRDERQFPDPTATTSPASRSGHLGFGGGVHACLGSAIARIAIRIAVEEFHEVAPEYDADRSRVAVDAVLDLPQPARAEARDQLTGLTRSRR